jgi:small acid-soluble spore protein (thioredoxin-like protein)
MNSKPDDRSDNVERIQHNINMTIHNMELADELIEETSDKKMKQALSDKNERRERALEGMRNEIRGEAAYQQKLKGSDMHTRLRSNAAGGTGSVVQPGRQTGMGSSVGSDIRNSTGIATANNSVLNKTENVRQDEEE